MRSTATAPLSRIGRRWVTVAALILTLVVVLANVHLVYVAIHSQPECVVHHPGAETGSGETARYYRAARPAC